MGAGQAQQHAPAAGKGVEAASKIYNIIDEQSSIDPFQTNENEIIATKDNFKGKIEFIDVWFRYPTRKDNWILKGLNMKINHNECIGFVGQSGSGKSTIVQLIYRFYDPQRGQILIDGEDIKHYNIRSLRAMFGLVQQEPVLFNCSVKDNICYGKDDATAQEIENAAKIANANTFIEETEEDEKDHALFPKSAMQPLRKDTYSDHSHDGLPEGYKTI